MIQVSDPPERLLSRRNRSVALYPSMPHDDERSPAEHGASDENTTDGRKPSTTCERVFVGDLPTFAPVSVEDARARAAREQWRTFVVILEPEVPLKYLAHCRVDSFFIANLHASRVVLDHRATTMGRWRGALLSPGGSVHSRDITL